MSYLEKTTIADSNDKRLRKNQSALRHYYRNSKTILEKRKKSYLNWTPEQKESCSTWRKTKKIECRLSKRAYRKKNIDKVRKYGAEWMRGWRRKNPEKNRAAKNRRKVMTWAGKKDSTSETFYKFVRSKKSIPCYYCGNTVAGKDAHVDHVIALSKSGNHASDNLAASCATCNLRKGTRLPSELHFTDQPLLNL